MNETLEPELGDNAADLKAVFPFHLRHSLGIVGFGTVLLHSHFV